MSQGVRVIVRGTNFGGDEAYGEAVALQMVIDKINRADREVRVNGITLDSLNMGALGLISTINALRFNFMDLAKLSQGKGGMGDWLDLVLGFIIILDKVSDVMRIMRELQAVSLAYNSALGASI